MNEVPNTESLLEFPCKFPVKMMGRKESSFRETAIAIIERHTGTIDAGAVRTVPSSAGNFVSITVTIDALSQSQLDRIYEDLSASDDILVAL
jgi:putative lipoic acid-binding regulatory protein